jgi:ParB family chromosome partitioning protein
MIEKLEIGNMQMINIDQIDVLNPRDRNKVVFEEIITNIKSIGLKKPITVTPRNDENNVERFLLICGEGRMKAFRSLGETIIPALVVHVSDENAFIMSLTENIARRECKPLELLANIEQLSNQGYTRNIIAQKTGLSVDYVQGMLTLLKKGEERLLVAVESGRIPLNIAMSIVRAENDDKAVQIALQDAYETGQLRGRQLLQARKVIEQRQNKGRAITSSHTKKLQDVTSSSLVRVYQKEVGRQKQVVKKAEIVQQRLLFIIGALRELFSDDHFTTLLRAEGLDTLPQYLAEKIWPGGRLT